MATVKRTTKKVPAAEDFAAIGAYKPKRNGDAVLESAAKARATPETDIDPRDHLEAVHERVKDAPERKRAAGESEESVRRSEAALERLERALEIIESQSHTIRDLTKKTADLEEEKIGATKRPLKCGVCGQYVSVCHGDHVMMVVQPGLIGGSGWQGVTLNGVFYDGTCKVARSQAGVIANIIRKHELSELRLHMPVDKHFKVGLGGGVKELPASSTAD